jgi:hypothetical protein
METHMSSRSSSSSTQSKVTLIQAMLAGIAKHFANTASFQVNNEALQKAVILAAFQAYLAAVPVVAAAKAQYASSVQARITALASSNAMLKALTAYVRTTFGNEPAILADFGLKPITRKAPTPKVAAQAVELRAQTRTLRHTMGSQERLAIKATAAPPAPTTTGTPKS